jgi:hypothetical protein
MAKKSLPSDRAQANQALELAGAVLVATCVMAAIAFVTLYFVRSWSLGPTPAPSPSARASASPSPSVPVASDIDWQTADYTKAFTGQVPPLRHLTRAQAFDVASQGYDSMSFAFDGPTAPGYTVKYVDEVTQDGSGQTVDLPGEAWIQVVFTSAVAHDDDGQATLSPAITQPVTTGYPGLKAYVMNGDFEGQVSVALGTGAKRGFSVREIKQSGQWMVSIDVARP